MIESLEKIPLKTAKSMPFSHLGAASASKEMDPNEQSMIEEESSQVFLKRDRLFTVLNAVQLDV